MCFTISPMSIVLWCGWCKSPLLPIFFAHFSYFRGLFMYGHITDWVIGGYVGPSVWSYWCFYISAQHSGLLCVPTPDPLNTSQHNTSANNTSGEALQLDNNTPQGSTVYYTVQHGMELDKGGGGKAASAPPTLPTHIITARAWLASGLYFTFSIYCLCFTNSWLGWTYLWIFNGHCHHWLLLI